MTSSQGRATIGDMSLAEQMFYIRSNDNNLTRSITCDGTVTAM